MRRSERTNPTKWNKLAWTTQTINMHFNAGYLIKEYSYLFDVLRVFFAWWASERWCSGRVLSEERSPTSRSHVGRKPEGLTFSSSFLPEKPRGMTGDDALVEIGSIMLWCRFLEGHVNVMNEGRVLDAVHSLEAQRLLVEQGVYCIGPKFKAEKESQKIKFSSQCPDFLEKKTERKIDLLWGSIDYQNLNKTKKQYWHRDFQNRNTINKR